MELFEILKEVFKGMIRATSAYLFQKHVLDKKNHPKPSEAGWYSQEINIF